jgi:hypothetical protein
MNRPGSLEQLTEELGAVADKLRSGALGPDAAAELVERCAELAAQVGAEVDARARTASEAEGQERLL